MAARSTSLLLVVLLLVVLVLVVYIKLPLTASNHDARIDALAAKISENLQQQYPNVVSKRTEDSLGVKNWREVVSKLKGDWAARPDMKCMNIKKAGNWYICADGHFEVKPPCLVYSFGINKDWSFDEYMGNLGCEVHSFDPSIGKEDHIHSRNVHFHNLGLGSVDTDTFQPEFDIYVKKKVYWRVRTLKTIMKLLGHEGKTFDVLKMDIETDEWEVLIDIVNSGLIPDIKQFLIEWHLFRKYPSRTKYVDFYRAYKFMKDSGYKSYHKHFHHRDSSDRSLTLQCDATYLNIGYKTRA